MAQADIGLIGLAVMGENLVLNMESRGYTVAVYNRTTSKVDELLQGRGKGKKLVGAHSGATEERFDRCAIGSNESIVSVTEFLSFGRCDHTALDDRFQRLRPSDVDPILVTPRIGEQALALLERIQHRAALCQINYTWRGIPARSIMMDAT